MRATPRPDPRSIGARLAEKFPSKYRRRPATADAGRQRPKRPRISLKSEGKSRSRSAKLDSEVKRVVRDVEVLAAEKALEQSATGREMLRLMDARTQARFSEQLAGLGLLTSRETAEHARERHRRVCSKRLYLEYEKAWAELRDAEVDVLAWEQRYLSYREARELCDVEIRLLAEAAR